MGDSIIYKDKLHHVKNFGLLSTQFIRNDGCKIWVRLPTPAPLPPWLLMRLAVYALSSIGGVFHAGRPVGSSQRRNGDVRGAACLDEWCGRGHPPGMSPRGCWLPPPVACAPTGTPMATLHSLLRTAPQLAHTVHEQQALAVQRCGSIALPVPWLPTAVLLTPAWQLL